MSSRSSEAELDEFEKKVREVMIKLVNGPEQDGKPAKKKVFKDNAELVHAYKDHVTKCRVPSSSGSSKKAQLEPEDCMFGVSLQNYHRCMLKFSAPAGGPVAFYKTDYYALTDNMHSLHV